jgi:hypothetical protein
MAAFYLFVVIAVKQFVYDVTLRCAIFQADSILFMGAKYRINADSISKRYKQRKRWKGYAYSFIYL